MTVYNPYVTQKLEKYTLSIKKKSTWLTKIFT